MCLEEFCSSRQKRVSREKTMIETIVVKLIGHAIKIIEKKVVGEANSPTGEPLPH